MKKSKTKGSGTGGKNEKEKVERTGKKPGCSRGGDENKEEKSLCKVEGGIKAHVRKDKSYWRNA